MRKNLSHKYTEHQKALEGHGIITNRFKGIIYRLAVAPDGWCRVCVNRFHGPTLTVYGCPITTYDYKTPEEAIRLFCSIAENGGNYWDKDFDQGRVFYVPGENLPEDTSW